MDLFRACFLLIFLQQSCARNFPECIDDYFCYYGTKNDGGDFKLERKFGTADLPPDSKAILMIHAYTEKKYRIKMEGLSSTVKKIEFKRGEGNTRSTVFSCMKDNKNIVTFNAMKDGEILWKDVKSESKLGSLLCEHEFTTSKLVVTMEKDIKGTFLKGPYELFVDDRSQGQYYATKENSNNFPFCDPSRLKYKTQTLEKNKSYRKVNVHLNEAFCSKEYPEKLDSIFGNYSNFEYRLVDNSDYQNLKKIRCILANDKRRKWEMTLSTTEEKILLDADVDIDVRCASDAQFFCDYMPKISPGKEPLILRSPNKRGAITSNIECPRTHSYFVIKGMDPVKNAKFECRNFKGRMMWTFNETIISPEGPEVYCTNELDCKSIPNSNLHGSFLNEKNLPACHEGGQLQVKTKLASDNLNVKGFKCKRENGNTYYTVEGETKDQKWNDEHVYCHYIDTAAQEDADNKKMIIIILCTSSLASAIITMSIMGFCFFRVYKKRKGDKERMRDKDATESKRFKAIANKVDEHSGGSKKSLMSSSSAKKSGFDLSFSTKAKNDKKKGIFSDENGTIKEFAPPTGKAESIKKALLNNEKRKYRFDKFPEEYNFVYKEECKEVMEITLDRCKDNMLRTRQKMRERKAELIEKQVKLET